MDIHGKEEAALAVLNQYFGYENFRPGQAELIGHLFCGKDVLGIMPTGAGKSICYQVPALLEEGLTLVISPLISLMKDQVDALVQSGVPAGYINSSVSYTHQTHLLEEAEEKTCKLLYVAPERLTNEDFHAFLLRVPLSLVAVDEAHCVSQWGHDFRPSYMEIANMLGALPTRPPVAAFTATATPRVKEDIIRLLHLKDPFVLTTGFDRPNLYFGVETPIDKVAYTLRYVRRRGHQSGIIYCNTRKNVDQVWESLNQGGIKAVRYHAGMAEGERSQSQEAFLYDRVPVIVATNAFGMGIDKSNVRYVLHYNMPKSMESYYQEAGRAGRDGELSECILLYSAQDIVINKFIIDKNQNPDADLQEEHQKLKQMALYATGEGCLRRRILTYFGEKVTKNCGLCSGCDSELEEVDITIEAQKILSHVRRSGERETADAVIAGLRGEESTTSFAEDRTLSTFGILEEYSEEVLGELIGTLLDRGYLCLQDGGTLILLKKAWPLLKGKESLHYQRVVKQGSTRKNGIYNTELYEALSQLRWKLSLEQKMPPYTIFSDATLVDICKRMPKNQTDLEKVHGMGESKLERYGDSVLKVIAEYRGKKKGKRGKSPASPRTDTRQVTYELFQEGKTPQEIAKERGLNLQTILNHLVDCKLNGSKVDGVVQEEYEAIVEAAIEHLGTAKLKPLKEALPPQVDYTTISYYVKRRN